MAPPVRIFPLSQLEERAQYHTVNHKEKRRKVRNFDLETCELFELVQYSCTTIKEQSDRAAAGHPDPTKVECYPFVRLFRRCGEGKNRFHVETTAWEGQHAYETSQETEQAQKPVGTSIIGEKSAGRGFADYGSYFWSKK